MSLYELISISQGLSDRIDVQWGFFITMHMALFGGIVYVDRPLKRPEKWVAILLYSGFSFINYLMLNNQFSMLMVIYQDVVSVAGNHTGFAIIGYYENVFQSGRYLYVKPLIAIIHAIMFIIVLVSIIFDKEKDDLDAPADSRQSTYD